MASDQTPAVPSPPTGAKAPAMHNTSAAPAESPTSVESHASVESPASAAANAPAGANYTPRMHIVLFQPEIPPNTGAVGRTCVAVAAKLWLVRPLGFRVDEKTLRRAGLDYWRHLEWEVVDDWRALSAALPVERAWYFTKSARHSYADVEYRFDDILVFGSETSGLPPWILETHAARTLRIPTRPQVRSLNLSNSVAVAAYEADRQWRRAGWLDVDEPRA